MDHLQNAKGQKKISQGKRRNLRKIAETGGKVRKSPGGAKGRTQVFLRGLAKKSPLKEKKTKQVGQRLEL